MGRSKAHNAYATANFGLGEGKLLFEIDRQKKILLGHKSGKGT